MKVMSIIGIVWFSLSLICVTASVSLDEAAAWGMLGMLYAIPYSIVGLVHSNKQKSGKSTTQQLLELAELKEKGILSDDEFQAKKIDLLKQ